MRRVALLVLDGMGIGPAPDTAAYGDEGSNTLGNVARAAGEHGLTLPHLERLGLGRIAPIRGVSTSVLPTAAYGLAQPASAGKDSTTGHWELCGIVLEDPFPTYPRGFPDSVIAEFSRQTGRGVLANHPASGTVVIDQYGPEHQATGSWIVYTSADSVFQVAAHEDTVPLEELYQACRIARGCLVGPNAVSRVIARPFRGTPGAWERTSGRKDFSLPPVRPTLLDHLAAAGIDRIGVGKVDDLFAGQGITSEHAATNARAFHLIEEGQKRLGSGLLFANIIEFDQSWGHRNDVPGYVSGLQELDAWIPRLQDTAQDEDLIIFTADHGNDPTTPSTDHSRESVPILVWGPRVRAVSLGTRSSFADVGQTIAEYLGAAPLAGGNSFLSEVVG